MFESGQAVREEVAQEEEPIGIVIARGHHEEVAPRFSAYIWGVSQERDETDADEIASVAAA